jgi:predicted Zn-dependent protease
VGDGYVSITERARVNALAPNGRNLKWNWPIFVGSWIFLILLGLTLFLVHRWQRVNLADSLLKRSQAHQAKQEWNEAIAYMEKYVAFRQDDVARRVELVELVNQSPLDLRGIQALIPKVLTAIGLCETNPTLTSKVPGLRRSLIERQTEIGNYEGALQQIAKLAGKQEDPSIERMLAICRFRLALQQRQDQWDKYSNSHAPEWIWPLGAMHPVDLLVRSLANSPGDPDLTLGFASVVLKDRRLLQGSQLSNESDEALRQRLRGYLDPLLQFHPDDPKAWLTHFAILSQFDLSDAAAAVAKSLERFPDNVAILKAASQFHLERAQQALASEQNKVREQELQTAKALLQRAKTSSDWLQSRDSSVFSVLGDIEIEQGNIENALGIWNEGIKQGLPPTVVLHFQKAKLLVDLRRSSQARESLTKMDEAIRRESIYFSKTVVDPWMRNGKQLWLSFYITQNDFVSVSRLLDEIANSNVEGGSAFQTETLAVLANACLNISQWDRAGVAFEQAIALAPEESQYRRGAAEAWFRANRLSDSLKQWQAIANKSREDWFQLASVALSMQIQGVPEQATWAVFEDAFAKASRVAENEAEAQIQPWQLELLELESRVFRMAETERASSLATICDRVLELCQSVPNDENAWRQAAMLLQSWNRVDDAGRLSKLFIRSNPHSSLAVIEEARAMASKSQIDEATKILLELLDRKPADDIVLQEIFRWTRSPDETAALIERLLAWCGQDFMRLKRLGDWLVQLPILEGSEDSQPDQIKSRIERWVAPRMEIENRIRAIEGDRGSEWRWLMARRLLVQSEVDGSIGLDAIEEVARFLKAERPLWVSTYILEGLLAEKRSEPQSAIQAYEKAVSLGEDSPLIYERWINLLRDQGMTDQANDVIQRLGSRAMQSNQISAVAMGLALNDKSNLIRLAKLGIENRPRDPKAWVWYALVLDVSSRRGSAQEREASLALIDSSLRKAEVLSNGREIGVFNAAYDFYAATGQNEKIDAMLERIKSSNSISPDAQLLLMGMTEHSRGNLDLAEAHYRAALKSGGDHRKIVMKLSALFLQQGKFNECIEQLELVRKEFPEDYPLRELLAIVLATRGSTNDWDQLQKLLTDSQNANTAKDRRTLAKLLAGRALPGDLEQACSIIELLILDPKQRTTEDAFVLATIYSSQAASMSGRAGTESEVKRLNQLAEKQLSQITYDSTAKPEYLRAYANVLLSLDKLAKANEISQRLSILAPGSPDAMLLRAMVFKASDQKDAGIEFVNSWMTTQQLALPSNADPALDNQILAQSAKALFTIHAAAEATTIVNQMMERDFGLAQSLLTSLSRSTDPEVHGVAFDMLLASCRTRLDRDVAFPLMQLLSTNQFRGDRLQQAESLLDQFAADHPKDTEFRIFFADHWIVDGDFPKAISLLEQVVEIEPKSVEALNNLANLLAENPERINEAIDVIDRAIDQGGNQPNLLDSKGCILMQAGRFTEAIPILQEAAATGIDPRFKLHWFMALRGAGRKQDADRVRSQIDVQGLGATFLTPMDQSALKEILN